MALDKQSLIEESVPSAEEIGRSALTLVNAAFEAGTLTKRRIRTYRVKARTLELEGMLVTARFKYGVFLFSGMIEMLEQRGLDPLRNFELNFLLKVNHEMQKISRQFLLENVQDLSAELTKIGRRQDAIKSQPVRRRGRPKGSWQYALVDIEIHMEVASRCVKALENKQPCSIKYFQKEVVREYVESARLPSRGSDLSTNLSTHLKRLEQNWSTMLEFGLETEIK